MGRMYKPGTRCPRTGMYSRVKISIGLIYLSQIQVAEDTLFPETNEADVGYILDRPTNTKRLPLWL